MVGLGKKRKPEKGSMVKLIGKHSKKGRIGQIVKRMGDDTWIDPLWKICMNGGEYTYSDSERMEVLY